MDAENGLKFHKIRNAAAAHKTGMPHARRSSRRSGLTRAAGDRWRCSGAKLDRAQTGQAGPTAIIKAELLNAMLAQEATQDAGQHMAAYMPVHCTACNCPVQPRALAVFDHQRVDHHVAKGDAAGRHEQQDNSSVVSAGVSRIADRANKAPADNHWSASSSFCGDNQTAEEVGDQPVDRLDRPRQHDDRRKSADLLVLCPHRISSDLTGWAIKPSDGSPNPCRK